MRRSLHREATLEEGHPAMLCSSGCGWAFGCMFHEKAAPARASGRRAPVRAQVGEALSVHVCTRMSPLFLSGVALHCLWFATRDQRLNRIETDLIANCWPGAWNFARRLSGVLVRPSFARSAQDSRTGCFENAGTGSTGSLAQIRTWQHRLLSLLMSLFGCMLHSFVAFGLRVRPSPNRLWCRRQGRRLDQLHLEIDGESHEGVAPPRHLGKRRCVAFIVTLAGLWGTQGLGRGGRRSLQRLGAMIFACLMRKDFKLTSREETIGH